MMVKLVFDVPCIGFAKRYKEILEAKGIEVIIPPDWAVRNDFVLHEFAVRQGAIVVTTDKHFPDPKILLPMNFGNNMEPKKPKYEKWHTVLMKKLREVKNT